MYFCSGKPMQFCSGVDRTDGCVHIEGSQTTNLGVRSSNLFGRAKPRREINALKKRSETTRQSANLCPSHARKTRPPSMRRLLDGDEALPLQAFEYSERRRQQFTALAVVPTPRAIAASMVTIRSSAVTRLSLDFIATAA